MLPLGEMSPLILLDSSFGCFLTFTLSQDLFSFLSCKTDVLHSLKFATTTSGLVATGLGSDAGIVDYEDTIKKMNSLKTK